MIKRIKGSLEKAEDFAKKVNGMVYIPAGIGGLFSEVKEWEVHYGSEKQQNEFGVTSTSEGADRDCDSTTTGKQQKEYRGDLFKLEPGSGFLYRATEVDEDDNPVRYEFAGKLINNVEPKKRQKDTSYWTRRAALALEDINRNMTPEAMVKHISESCKRMDEMENEIFDDKTN